MDTAQTADYALRVLLRLEGSDGHTVSDLATHLAVSPSAMRRIVATLHRRALVTKTTGGRYVLGPGLISLGDNLTHELATLARPFLRELAEEAGEMVVLMVPDGDEGVVIARWSGTAGPLRIEYAVGARHALTRGAGGLVLLAYDDDEDDEARRALPVSQMAALAEIRSRGFARTHGQLRLYVEDIAVPVQDEAVGVVGALAVVVPSARAERLESILPQLQTAADSIAEAYALHFPDVAATA